MKSKTTFVYCQNNSSITLLGFVKSEQQCDVSNNNYLWMQTTKMKIFFAEGNQTLNELPKPFGRSLSCMIFPPLLLVFSTNRAVLIPCSDLPRPWPSLYPYFAIIFDATDNLKGIKF